MHSDSKAMFTGTSLGFITTAWTGLPRKYALTNQASNDYSAYLVLKETWFSQSVSRESNKRALLLKGDTIDIAVIGGGLCGVTCANALASKFTPDSPFQAKIKIYEGDTNSSESLMDADNFNRTECWSAATEKNGNSLVPGAAMSVMSQRSTISTVVKDTSREYGAYLSDNLNTFLGRKQSCPSSLDSFSIEPPYFGIDLLRCMGPSVSWNERLSFLDFSRCFMKTSLFSTKNSSEFRGQCLVKIANANKVALSNELIKSKGILCDKIGLNQGFISVYRDKQSAESVVKKICEAGESAKLLSTEEAMYLEPRMKYIPFQPLYFVSRPNDQSANCAYFVRHLIRNIQAKNISYENRFGNVQKVERLHQNGGTTKRFRVTTTEGKYCDYDHIVLANGIYSPLLAAQLGARKFCPIYPLRGFSLTLLMKAEAISNTKYEKKKGRVDLLRQGLIIDKIYCTSVTPNMARLAGFGEIAGYPRHADGFLTAGPRIMARYANMLFPEGSLQRIDAGFRPLSPDDLPIAGAVESVPGLYLHTGHGSLGWTLALATAECVAQDIYNQMNGLQIPKVFILPDGATLPRGILSPSRFK